MAISTSITDSGITKRHTFIIAIILHCVLAAGLLLFSDLKYEVSDDFIMELILSGAFNGKTDPHILFSNYIWGLFLELFYRFFPGISWYLIAQILVSTVSFFAVYYIITQSYNRAPALIISSILAVFFCGDLYVLVQFTKTAVTAISCGGFLFLWAILHNRSRICILLGTLLIIIGFFIRYNTLFIAAPFLFFYFLIEISADRSRLPQIYKRLLVWSFSIGFILLILYFLNKHFYFADDNYHYYKEFSKVRSQIIDYPLPAYELYQEQFARIGISQNDYNLLVSWSFSDPEIFSLETMQQILEIVKEYRHENPMSILQILHTLLSRRYFYYYGVYACVLLGILYLYFIPRKAWIPFSCAGIILVFLSYFVFTGRCIYRIEFGFFFGASLLMCITKPEVPISPYRHIRMTRLLLAFICCCQLTNYIPDHSYKALTQGEYRTYVDSTFYYSWNFHRDKYKKVISDRVIRPEFLAQVASDPDHLYLLDFNTTIQTLYYDFSPFFSVEKESLQNMIYLGGVTVNHPAITDALDSWNISNPLSALIQDNVYLVSNTTSESILAYLQEHYYPNAQKKLHNIIDGYEIWDYYIP